MEIEDFDLSDEKPKKGEGEAGPEAGEAGPEAGEAGPEAGEAVPEKAAEAGPEAGGAQSPFSLGPLEESAEEVTRAARRRPREAAEAAEPEEATEVLASEEATERGFHPPEASAPAEEETVPVPAEALLESAPSAPEPPRPEPPRPEPEPGAILLDEGGEDPLGGGYERSGFESELYPSHEREGLPALWLALILLALVGAAFWVYWQFFRQEAEIPTESPELAVSRPAPPPSAAEPRPPEPEPLELPPLAESDPFLRTVLTGLSSRPELARWLATDGLVERFVASVDNVARGESPRKHMPFLAPAGDFEAEVADGLVQATAGTYGRYDLLTRVVLSLDTEAAADLYEQLLPLLDEGYQRLGYPEGEFEAVLARAFQRLNRVVIPAEAPELEARLKSYHYADPELEVLSEAEKHLLRLGPENARQVQLKLRQLARALDLDG